MLCVCLMAVTHSEAAASTVLMNTVRIILMSRQLVPQGRTIFHPTRAIGYRAVRGPLVLPGGQQKGLLNAANKNIVIPRGHYTLAPMHDTYRGESET
jgi:hypothetical protein